MLPFAALFFLLAAAIPSSRAQCDLSGTVDFDTDNPIETFSGCPGSFFRFDIERLPVDSDDTDLKTFDFYDQLTQQALVGLTTDFDHDFSFTSYSSEVVFTWVIKDQPHLPVGIQSIMAVTYTEIPLILAPELNFDSSRNGSMFPETAMSVSTDPNTRTSITFEGVEQSVHRYDMIINLVAPTFGSVFVSTGNGRLGALNMQRGEWPIGIAIQPLNETTTMHVIMGNQLQEQDLDDPPEFQIVDFFLGMEEEPSSTTTTTTTTTVDPDAAVVPIYIVGVNENEFANNSYTAFQKAIEDMAPADSTCDFAFAGPFSCREACYLTNKENKGCVKTIVNVLPSVYCAYSNNMLRDELTNDKLNSLAKDFNADRCEIDDCMAEVQAWKLAAILVPVTVILLLFIALFTARWLTNRRRKEMRMRQWEQQAETEAAIKGMKEQQKYAAMTGGAGGGLLPGGGGGMGTMAFDSPFEIVDEEDED